MARFNGGSPVSIIHSPHQTSGSDVTLVDRYCFDLKGQVCEDGVFLSKTNTVLVTPSRVYSTEIKVLRLSVSQVIHPSLRHEEATEGVVDVTMYIYMHSSSSFTDLCKILNDAYIYSTRIGTQGGLTEEVVSVEVTRS